jgi:hypothetical protein
MFNADPANLSGPVPKVMCDAAALVRAHGAFLGERQDELVNRLEAPYAPRIQREVRDALTAAGLSDRERVARLLEVADRLGLAVQPAPQPLPPIESDDIHLICWTVILPESPVPASDVIVRLRSACSSRDSRR